MLRVTRLVVSTKSKHQDSLDVRLKTLPVCVDAVRGVVEYWSGGSGSEGLFCWQLVCDLQQTTLTEVNFLMQSVVCL